MTQILHGRIQYAKNTAADLPFSIKPHKAGVALWEDLGHGNWTVIATFARRSDAELFVFAKAPPIWGEN